MLLAQPVATKGNRLKEKAVHDRRRDIFARLFHFDCDEWYMPYSVRCVSLEWKCGRDDQPGSVAEPKERWRERQVEVQLLESRATCRFQ